MQRETDGTRRAAIFGFPAQFGSIGSLLSDLLDQVFTGSRFAQPPWVRGVYFTSGTQEGSPIDRVMGSLSRSFGIERAMLAPQKSQRAQLLPHIAAARGGVSRAAPGGRRREAGAPPPHCCAWPAWPR
jgi:type VI protein secretion system component VasK